MRKMLVEELPLKPATNEHEKPLYQQIEIDLRRMIQAGILVPGDMLPPETQLCMAYNVGRHTMRQALAQLVNDEVIERRAGRGTQIRKPRARLRFCLDRGFTQLMHDMHMIPTSKVLVKRIDTIGNHSPEAMSQSEKAPCLILERVRYGNGEPVGVQTTTVITHRCPGLDEFDFEQDSLYRVLTEDFDLQIDHITHTVGATKAGAIHSDALQVELGEALVMVKSNAYLSNKEIIEHTVSYYRADKYEYNTSYTSYS